MSLKDLLQQTNITSFDLETTGTFENPNFRVTQFGVATSTGGYEFAIRDSFKPRKDVASLLKEELDWMDDFNKNLPPGSYPLQQHHLLQLPTEQVLLEAHALAGAADFGKSQYDSGALKSVVDTFRANVWVDANGQLQFKDQVKTLKDATEELKKTLVNNPGVVLIQNVQFERGVYKNSVGIDLNTSDAIDFTRRVWGRTSSDSFFDFDKGIWQAKDKYRDAVKALKEGVRLGNATDAQRQLVIDQAKALEKVMEDRLQKAQAKGTSVLFDLMDFTDTFQARLLDKQAQTLIQQVLPGWQFNPLTLQRGRSVEVLAEALLGETETHTALSDAQQQTKILNKLIVMSSDLDNGVITQDTLNYIKALSDPQTYRKDFLKTVHSRLNDISLKVDEMVKNHVPIQDIEKFVGHAVQSTMSSIVQNYQGLPEAPDFTRAQVAQHLTQYVNTNSPQYTPLVHAQGPTPPPPKQPSNISTKVLNLQTTIAAVHHAQKNAVNTQMLNNMTPPSQVASTSAQIVNPTNKTGLGKVSKYGLYTLGAIALMEIFASEHGMDERDPMFKNDTYDALYGNLLVGKGYADYKERTNSHKLIY